MRTVEAMLKRVNTSSGPRRRHGAVRSSGKLYAKRVRLYAAAYVARALGMTTRG